MVGANVTIDGTAYGAATGPEGSYEINIPSGDISGASVILTASYIGYKNGSQQVNVPASGSVTQNFSLAVDAIGMKAVSVTALGFTANRDEQGSSSVSVAAADMTRSGESLMGNSLAAKASNVIVNAVAGDPGASTSIKIRGANTISGASQPLIIIDGMPMNNSTVYGGGNNISGGRSSGTVQQSRLNDLNAKIAIGSSVQPKIIFLHFFLTNSLIAGLIDFSAALTFPIFTNLIALLTDFF